MQKKLKIKEKLKEYGLDENGMTFIIVYYIEAHYCLLCHLDAASCEGASSSFDQVYSSHIVAVNANPNLRTQSRTKAQVSVC